MPPLNSHTSSGKLVLERSELGKSCLRQDATLFAESSKFARDIFCQKSQKVRVTSFVRDAHIVKISYTRASQANHSKRALILGHPAFQAGCQETTFHLLPFIVLVITRSDRSDPIRNGYG